jgi:hypothetical protein
LKVIYYCDCCQDVLEEVDVEDLAGAGEEDSLTDEEWQDIMNLQENQENQHYISTLCQDCIRELGMGDEESIHYKAIIH